MERSWWWKAALFGAAIILAGLYLVPTVVTDEAKLPGLFQKYFKKRIQLGLDLKGGLHLVYTVNIEKAVASKVDRLANDVEDALKKKGADVSVVRSGRDDIAVEAGLQQLGEHLLVAWPGGDAQALQVMTGEQRPDVAQLSDVP